jgi:hypothetical protein
LKYFVVNSLFKKRKEVWINQLCTYLLAYWAFRDSWISDMSKYQHFQNHHIFAAEQYGFRRGMSTTNATHRLTEIILNAGNIIDIFRVVFVTSQ